MARLTYKQLDQVSFGDLEVYSVLPEHPIWSENVSPKDPTRKAIRVSQISLQDLFDHIVSVS